METRAEKIAELMVNVMYVLLGAFEFYILPYQDTSIKVVCLVFAVWLVTNRSWIKRGIQKNLEDLRALF